MMAMSSKTKALESKTKALEQETRRSGDQEILSLRNKTTPGLLISC
jgi:hypothetical protein